LTEVVGCLLARDVHLSELLNRMSLWNAFNRKTFKVSLDIVDHIMGPCQQIISLLFIALKEESGDSCEHGLDV
jgi:hypothetical protein